MRKRELQMKHLLKNSMIELMLLCLLIVACFPFVTNTPVQKEFSDAASWTDSYQKPTIGSGTAEDPYQVSTAAELAYFVNYTQKVSACSAVIKLVDNIDLAGKQWAGIGCEKYPFTGQFDGDGHQIFNLDSDVGFFGFVNGINASNTAVIKNVLVRGTVSGAGNIAGIVARAEGNVTISGCVNFCDVKHSSDYAGSDYAAGIVAYALGTGKLFSITIEKCANYGTIQGTYVGGIAGYLYRSTITNCVNNGNLTCVAAAAGIVNLAEYVFMIQHCYNGEVTFTSLGGYQSAGILNEGTNVGGIQHCFDLATSVTNTMAYYPISNIQTGSHGSNYYVFNDYFFSIGKYLANLKTLAKTPSWYDNSSGAWNEGLSSSWDLNNTWYVSGSKYPMLKHKLCITLDKEGGTGGTNFVATQIGASLALPSITIPTKNGSEFRGYYQLKNGAGLKMYNADGSNPIGSGIFTEYMERLYAFWGVGQDQLWSSYSTKPTGAGTTASPYIVYTPKELAYFAYITRTNVCNAVIQLKAEIDLAGYYWEPIGNAFPFTGRFDGQGYAIRNIKVDVIKNGGLFGSVSNGVISNVYLRNGLIVGSENVGGIVGAAANTQVQSCFNAATINGTGTAVKIGGIVGYASGGGMIDGCFAIANIGGHAQVGGIVGRYDGGSDRYLITGCFVEGGVISNTTDPFISAMAFGSNIGGIVGSVDTTGDFKIESSFVNATINLSFRRGVTTASVGGIIGVMNSSSTASIQDCGYYGNIIFPASSKVEAHDSIYGTFNGTILNSFGSNISGQSVMVGTSFSNWGYSPYINNGIPLHKSLSPILAQGNQDVYSYLVSKGFVQLAR